MKIKERSKRTLNKRQKTFENSTRRQSLDFEYVLTKTTTTTTINLTSNQIQVLAIQFATQSSTQRKRKATSKDDCEEVESEAIIDIRTSAKASRKRRSTKIDLKIENQQLKKTLKAFIAILASIIATISNEVISRLSKNVVDVGNENDNANLSKL